MMIKFFLILFLLCGVARAETSPVDEQKKIDCLLTEIQQSNAHFERNGQTYTAVEAHDHMRDKWNYVGGKIKTAEQFIDYIGTKSSLSGRFYYVLTPDGRKIPSREWLTEKLHGCEKSVK